MFDNLKGMSQVASLLRDLPKLKARMEEAKERLGDVRVDAETGGGAVRATADGHMKIVALHVEPGLMSALVDPALEDDRAMAEDLIAGAVNQALVRAREAAEAELRGAAEELGLPVPPGALDGLLS